MADSTAIEQVKAELHRIAEAIQQQTGLISRWNGELTFVPADSRFKGLKAFSCSMLLREDLITDEARWRTWIHESYHACSAGYNQIDFQAQRGWEEGLVEKLQRLTRAALLQQLSVVVNEAVFLKAEQENAFNAYVTALEAIQPHFSEMELGFYCDLLQTPIKDRYRVLLNRTMRMDTMRRNVALSVLSASRPILEGRLPA